MRTVSDVRGPRDRESTEVDLPQPPSDEDLVTEYNAGRANALDVLIERYYQRVLRQADESRYAFGFLCADVKGVSAEIAAPGIEMIATSDGPTFVDPDGNRVTLFPARTTPSSHMAG